MGGRSTSVFVDREWIDEEIARLERQFEPDEPDADDEEPDELPF